MEIYEELLKARKEGKNCAVATIIKTVGCTPRSAGTKMLVFEDAGFVGTIGGGSAEKQCIEDCLEAMQTGKTAIYTYSPQTLTPLHGESDCKKNIQVFIEPYISNPVVYILGGGHVAQAVLPVLKQLGFVVIIYDIRDLSAFGTSLSQADELRRIGSYTDLKEKNFARNSAFLICTHSHATDGEAAEAIIGKSAYYIGMLGAKHKFVPIFRKLLDQGVSMEKIQSIYAPAGLDIGGESPESIAISIAAEISAVRNERSARHLRDVKHDAIFEFSSN